MERLSKTATEILNELHTERLDYTGEYIPLIDAINKLAEYEDAEEQGLLLRLPCKVDGTLWRTKMGDIIDRCPVCKGLPTIGTEAISGKPMVACMNICCSNMMSFTDDSVGVAMVNWNNWCKKHISLVKRKSSISLKCRYCKCRDCRWLDLNQKSTVGCLCTNPRKQFKSDTAQWKYPSTKACRLFEKRKDDTEC